MFYSISLCTLILTYFYKNKSTIRENVVWIFCIICHVVFCLFFIIILYYSLFFHPFSLFFKYPSKFYRFIENKEIKKIILSRPAVEAGEKLGFLPGDMKDKIDPYLQPLYDALQDMIPAAKLKEYMELNIIQIAPLAFMRGRTLNDAVVILDEAQNTTAQQIKMFLTRMGMNTKMIVTGDMTQIDLPASQTSGLVQALRILKGVKGISFVELNKKDIVRHKLVERIVDAYEKFDKEAKAEREKRKNEQLVINGERPVKQVNN